ncbi:MAG: hypothetical protein IT582_04675 [Opitutaceae bacterium]|nr:hypothetical protein [Opitutaceae bacterium]
MLGLKSLVRRVLIVSPHFPPVNAPDMQRARIALPYLRQLGWEPVVLAVAPDLVEGAVIDPLLEQTYPSDIRVIRVRGISPKLTRRFGVGSLWWRCAHALRKAGDALLAKEKFDLVFFTTTQFDAFTFGPRWLEKFGVPYVLDYQDPWVNDYYRLTKTRPPGGKLRFGFSQFTARRREPKVVQQAAAILSVSPAYNRDLRQRYPDLNAATLHHLPFGAATGDLELARRHTPARPHINQQDGKTHLVYTGRCGPDMRRSLSALFRAIKLYRDTHPAAAARLHLHFIGTGYAPPPLGENCVTPLAIAAGVGDHVSEICYRIPYFEALHYLANAAALMVVGSDDPAYNASKLFPYLLSRRPLLTVAHNDSPMFQLAHEQSPASTFGFPGDPDATDIETLSKRICDEWFVNRGWASGPTGDVSKLEAHTASGMTQRLAAIFSSAVIA